MEYCCRNLSKCCVGVIVKEKKLEGETWMQNFQTKEKEPSWSSAVTIYQAGGHGCKPGYAVGPMIRDHYLIHCVLDGKGIFRVGETTYTVERGEGFLITPGVVTYYQADEKNPWHYCWIGLQGRDVPGMMRRCGVSMENPMFSFQNIVEMEQCISQMASNYSRRGGGFLALAKLYEFFSMVQGDDTVKGSPLKLASRVRRFIDRNYSYHINVERIAEIMGCNRSHMFRVFKEENGVSVQEYLKSVRMEHARNMMEQTEMSVTEIMYSCGFDDLPNFSRQFKNHFGVSPGAVRKLPGGIHDPFI